jgi:hypothetical protein
MSGIRGILIVLVGLVSLAIPIVYLAEPHLYGSEIDQVMQLLGYVALTLPFTLPIIIILVSFAMAVSR